MLKIKITDRVLQAAQKRADLFVNNPKSKTKIKAGSEIYGMIGEELFLANFGGKLIDSKNYDIDHPILGKIDVKTKSATSDPKDTYECSVAAYQMNKPECEFYVFYRVDKAFKYGWYCGILSLEDFKAKAVLRKRGERDGGFVFSTDCYNVTINNLYDIDKYMKKPK